MIRFINYNPEYYFVIVKDYIFISIFLAFVIFVSITPGGNPIIPTYAIDENATSNSILNIRLSSIEGSLLSNGTFLITPDPFQKDQSFLITDNSNSDKDKSEGLISLFDIASGNYIITQKGTSGNYMPSTISKIVTINQTNPVNTASFVNTLKQSSAQKYTLYQPSSMYTYNAKFVCGSIKGDEGPLRPGYYDTDISIYNKQKYPLNISWNVVSNNGKSSNSILTTLQPEKSIGIICKDIKKMINSSPSQRDLIEGFVILSVDSTTIKSNNVIAEPGLQKSSFTEEPVSIQVFYTANALDTLPHEILIDKIVFQILGDPTGKIPASFLNTDLGIITTAQLNKISNENSKIKNMLATEFNLTESELATIPTSIKDTDVAATTMIDDHAISLSRLAP